MSSWLVNQRQAAAFLGVTTRTFQRWGWKPHAEEGRQKLFDLREIAQKRYGDEAAQREVLDLTAERARLARAQAEKQELDLAERQGELIPAEAVVDTWADVLSAFRAKVLALASFAAGAAARGETVDSLADSVRAGLLAALGELADFDPVAGRLSDRDQDGAANGRTTTGANGQRVGGSVPDPKLGSGGRARPLEH